MIAVIKDSQFFTDLDQIINCIKSDRDMGYIIKGLENTKAKGYELVKEHKLGND